VQRSPVHPYQLQLKSQGQLDSLLCDMISTGMPSQLQSPILQVTVSTPMLL